MIICGIDEAGRGPLAGPVTAAAVILGDNFPVEFLNDSKKMSPLQREKAFDQICSKALYWSTGWIEADEIDKINILQASLRAMEKAYMNLGIQADMVRIDGNKLPNLPVPAVAIVHGDAIDHSIMAASIVAKVLRDRKMEEYDKQYPEYGFSRNKGYPTQSHKLKIKEYGLSPIHRKTFNSELKKQIPLFS